MAFCGEVKPVRNNQSTIRAALLGLAMLLAPCAALAAGETFSLNLKGADLSTLIETVSKATGKNFIVAPNVRGKVTLVSSRPMTADELYGVFLSVLSVHGFIAAPSGGAIKILPDSEIKFSAPAGTLNGMPDGQDEVVVRVFEMSNVPAASLVPVLRPLVSPKGHMAAYGPSNMLIVGDFASAIHRLSAIIARVDQPTSAEVEVITLQNASAVELVRVLTSVEAERNKAMGQNAQPGEGSTLVADERSNSILLGGDRGNRLRIRALISHLDTPVEVLGSTQVVHLRYAKAVDIAKVLTDIGQNFAEGAAKVAGNQPANKSVSVHAYESANALVITAPPALARTLRAVIAQLDVRRAQVLVEAVIAEVDTDKAAEFGIQWSVTPNNGDTGFMGGTNFNTASGGINSLRTSLGPLATMGGLSVGFIDGTSTLLGDTYLNLGGLARALRSASDANVLQTPTVVMLDNEQAEIVVGENVPFVTGTTNVGNGTANPFTTIERKDVGLNLKVTPQINEGDTIRLDISQELSDVKNTPTAGVGSDEVVTNKRSIKTAVMVEDGQVLVLGGLMRNRQSQGEDKVPLLGDVPVLGNLFRYRTTTTGRTNLMVFLRPVILRNAEDGRMVSANRYRQMRDWQLAVKPMGPLVDVGQDGPRLPDYQDYADTVRRYQSALDDQPGEPASAVKLTPPTPLGVDTLEPVEARPEGDSPSSPPAARPEGDSPSSPPAAPPAVLPQDRVSAPPAPAAGDLRDYAD
ncbi:MAG: type II secretion system secretin GspD [Magnetococcus sp. WYHC-3]